jgi:hypothetical protein
MPLTADQLNVRLNSYLALQADSLAEGDMESAEELGAAIERVCAALDALAA